MPSPARPPSTPRPAVFLDRDDTLNENADLPFDAFPGTPGDLFLPDHLRLLPGVLDACRDLARAGFALVVITNQAGVARGPATIPDIEATNDRLRALLTNDRGRPLLDGVYAAPHHPVANDPFFQADAHPWRKPAPGMILAACEELALDPARSWMIGDAPRDCEAGRNAGLDPARCLRLGPDADFPDLAAAARHILEHAHPHEDPTQTASASPAASPAPALTAVPASVVSMRARAAHLLEVPPVRDTVQAAAHAIAERTGIALLAFQITDGAAHATLAASRLAALGFMAELRRNTNAWHAARYAGQPLWLDPGQRHD